MENNNQTFRQFSDQLRHQSSNFANLNLKDSIWSNSYGTKRLGDRKNFDLRVGGDVNSLNNLDSKGSDFNGFNVTWGNSFKAKVSDSTGFNDGWNSFKAKSAEINISDDGWSGFKGKSSDLNALSDNWKIETPGFGPGAVLGGGSQIQKSIGINSGFNKGIFSKPTSYNITNNINLKGYKNSGKNEDYGGKCCKNSNKKHFNNNNNNENKDSKSVADKKFKTLPASESLPRNETIGGYIFVCNNDTMQENLKRQLFGLPPRYRDSVRAITPGLPLFLYNYSTHQLHGVFEASSFGGTNIDPTAWEDKKCPGDSRFPAQVKVVTRKILDPLEEDSFRPILHHYDGPKFRLELNVPEAISLLDIFAEQENP